MSKINKATALLGASNLSETDRADNDFYATPPSVVKMLLEKESFDKNIWEPAAGLNHITNVLIENGHTVYATDIIQRLPTIEIQDFFTCNKEWDGDIITNPPYTCFDSDTQCYTKRGWLYYTDIKESDEILSVNPYTMELEWSTINSIIIRDKTEDEKMYHFKKSHMDIMVTDNHRMFAFNVKNNKLSIKDNDLIKSKYIRSTHYIPKLGYTWKGTQKDTFVLPSIDGCKHAHPVYKEEIQINMNSWLEFFGLWLADGCCRHTTNINNNYRKTVTIKQSEKTAYRVREILSKLPFTYKEYADIKDRKSPCISFEIHNEQLWQYLKQFGKSADKFIPDDIKNLTSQQISYFLDAYFFGDGSLFKTKTSEARIFSTVSKKLAEDIQELLLKTGLLSHVVHSKYKTSDGITHMLYKIYENRNSIYNHMYFPSNKNDKCAVEYTGKVWCLNLKKNGVFLLRRNGLEFFCGNCAGEFVTKAMELIKPGHKLALLLKIQFLEGKGRRALFKKYPPKVIYVSTSRFACVKNGNFTSSSNASAVCYAWFVWEKGFTGDPIIKWFND